MELPRHDPLLMQMLHNHVTRKREKRNSVRVENIEIVNETNQAYCVSFSNSLINLWIPHSVIKGYDWGKKQIEVEGWFANSSKIKKVSLAILLKKREKASLYKVSGNYQTTWLPKRYCLSGNGFMDIDRWLVEEKGLIRYNEKVGFQKNKGKQRKCHNKNKLIIKNDWEGKIVLKEIEVLE